VESALATIAHYLGLAIEAMALLVVTYGTIETFVSVVRMVTTRALKEERRAVWIHFLRWMVAALTFQVAADIVHTSIAPTWDEVGRLAAIAAVRTMLSYFLERDLREAEGAKRDALRPA
jgi:uncharacterized membrane protein